MTDTYKITARPNVMGRGTVSGGGNYAEGTSVTLTASAADGYAFDSWDDGVATSSRSVTVGDEDATYTAVFREEFVPSAPYRIGGNTYTREFIGLTADKPASPELSGDIFHDLTTGKKYIGYKGTWYEITW